MSMINLLARSKRIWTLHEDYIGFSLTNCFSISVTLIQLTLSGMTESHKTDLLVYNVPRVHIVFVQFLP